MAENSKPLSPDPEALARAKVLEEKACRTVEGLPVVSRRSSFHEYARDFSGQREFSADDKERQKSWRDSARKGKFSLRQFDDNTHLQVHLVIDGSASMRYASADTSKFDYAKDFAACLSYLTLLQRDSVQLSLFEDKMKETTEVVKQVEGFSGLVEKISSWQSNGPTGIGDSIRDLAENLLHGGLVILLSDFLEESETWIEAVERIRFHGNEVILVQVLDRDEIEFPFSDLVEFEAMEGGENFQAHGAEVRGAYLEEMKLFFEKMREVSSRCGSHYLLADTSKPLAEALESYARLRRQGRRLEF